MIFALLCAAFSSVGAAFVGVFVVVRRLSMLAGSLSHCIFAGLGICLWLQRVWGVSWAYPLMGALITGLLAALLIGYIHMRYKEREDALMSMLWSFGMALGLLFVFLTPGYVGDLHDFLFGNILWVKMRDVWIVMALDILIMGLLVWQRHRVIAVCFDEELARIQKLPVKLIYICLLMLITAAVVALIHIIGVVLVMTLLVVPPMIASLWTHNFFSMTVASSLLGLVIALLGCWIAYYVNIPPSPAIALIAGGVYFLSLCFRRRVSC